MMVIKKWFRPNSFHTPFLGMERDDDDDDGYDNA